MTDMHAAATRELVLAYAEYEQAKSNRARWEAIEKAKKEDLIRMLGLKEDPAPLDVVDTLTGETLYSVKVGTWRGLDQKTLKAERPDIYAMYETSKATVSIKGA